MEHFEEFQVPRNWERQWHIFSCYVLLNQAHTSNASESALIFASGGDKNKKVRVLEMVQLVPERNTHLGINGPQKLCEFCSRGNKYGSQGPSSQSPRGCLENWENVTRKFWPLLHDPDLPWLTQTVMTRQSLYLFQTLSVRSLLPVLFTTVRAEEPRGHSLQWPAFQVWLLWPCLRRGHHP